MLLNKNWSWLCTCDSWAEGRDPRLVRWAADRLTASLSAALSSDQGVRPSSRLLLYKLSLKWVRLLPLTHSVQRERRTSVDCTWRMVLLFWSLLKKNKPNPKETLSDRAFGSIPFLLNTCTTPFSTNQVSLGTCTKLVMVPFQGFEIWQRFQWLPAET